jgi:copper(I)-binding protein
MLRFKANPLFSYKPARVHHSMKVYLNKIHILSIIFLAFAAQSSLAKDPPQSESFENNQNQNIIAINAIMPEVPAVSRTAAIYLTLKNKSNNDIVIDSVDAEIATHAMFHQTVEKDGVAKMLHRDKLLIPAKQSLELSKGGTHIMLMGLNEVPESKQFILHLGNAQQQFKVLVKVVARK